MIQWLGKLLYWASCTAAGMGTLIAAALLFGIVEGGIIPCVAMVFLAGCIWAFGRACRYILTGF